MLDAMLELLTSRCGISMKMDYIAAGSYVCVLVGVLVGGQPSGEKGRGR